MLGPNYILMGRARGTSPPPPAFDADYQAVLNYATSQGFTLPSSGQQTLQNDMLVAMKTAGIWAKLDRFYVFATNGNADFACIDWKAPGSTTNALRVNSPTFTANQGINGDGSTSYLDLQYDPAVNAVNFTQNDASMGAWEFTNVQSNFSVNASANLRFSPFSTTESKVRTILNSASQIVSTNTVSSSVGLCHLARPNSTQVRIYFPNQSIDELVTNSSSAIIAGTLFLGRQAANYVTRRYSIFYIGAAMNSDRATMNTILTTYMSAI